MEADDCTVIGSEALSPSRWQHLNADVKKSAEVHWEPLFAKVSDKYAQAGQYFALTTKQVRQPPLRTKAAGKVVSAPNMSQKNLAQ